MLTNKIETTDLNTLSTEVEKIALTNGGIYIDAVISVCENHNIDPVIASKFLSKPIVEKIKIEGQEVNLLPKEIDAKLPI
jgi:hypothetical protein